MGNPSNWLILSARAGLRGPPSPPWSHRIGRALVQACGPSLPQESHSEKRMKRIAGTRCLVTGGAGFIGSTIVDQLLDAGAADVIVLDNFVRGSWSNLAAARGRRGVKIVRGDICDAALVDELVSGM